LPLGLRPSETPPASDGFPAALEFVLDREGGYYDGKNPRDPNPTNRGVTQKAYDTWRRKHGLPVRPVKLMTVEEAVEFYREEYWPAAAGLADPRLQLVVFDTAVNFGVDQAREWVTLTRDANTYILIREVAYRWMARHSEKLRANLNGWLNRNQALRQAIG
jgi:lysozyme family protein